MGFNIGDRVVIKITPLLSDGTSIAVGTQGVVIAFDHSDNCLVSFPNRRSAWITKDALAPVYANALPPGCPPPPVLARLLPNPPPRTQFSVPSDPQHCCSHLDYDLKLLFTGSYKVCRTCGKDLGDA